MTTLLANPVMLPHHVYRNVMGDEFVDGLLDYVYANRDRFEVAKVGGKDEATLSVRVASILNDTGPYRALFEAKVREMLPQVTKDLGVPAVDPKRIEVQLAAHGDGAFYARHLDIQTGSQEGPRRLVSMVYYFYRLPKAFTGGALRLYALGPNAPTQDVEPARDSLLAFPAWAPTPSSR
ncbi:2OG-Fe(II) oxygenase [Aerophototrophica crusticola]|uniref:2OG-Fe(II) oxygenase n=1 Tax=Aerophototrophica crusticola TaxID=1709002 RepID=A0A858R479_9PROT|nr:2OG-Fe(II) oxygenase [Rhodospirillaceae bacterium B3]